MKQIKQKLIMCAMLGVGIVQRVTSFESMPQVVSGVSSVVPFLVDPSKGYNELNVACFETDGGSSNVTISLPATLPFSSGFWMLFGNISTPGGSTPLSLYFGCSIYNRIGGSPISSQYYTGNRGINYRASTMHFDLGNNGTYANAPSVPWNTNNVGIFILNKPTKWNPVTPAQGGLPNQPTALSKYLCKNKTIGGNTPVIAGISLHKNSLNNDLQIMLISTAGSAPDSYSSTIVASLDKSSASVALGNLSDGIYIVLSQPLPGASGSKAPTGMTYNLYTKSGASLGSGTVSTFGAISLPAGAVIDGMLLFGSCFVGGVYPLAVSASAMPQVFLLQHPSPTAQVNGTALSCSANGSPSGTQNPAIISLTQKITDEATTQGLALYSSNTPAYNFAYAQSQYVSAQDAFIGAFAADSVSIPAGNTVIADREALIALKTTQIDGLLKSLPQ